MIGNLARSWWSYKHCTQKDVYGTTRTRGVKNLSRFLRCYMPYLEYEAIWRAIRFMEHVLSDNKNDNAHKLFFTSSQNSTFSLNIHKFVHLPNTYLCVTDNDPFICQIIHQDVDWINYNKDLQDRKLNYRICWDFFTPFQKGIFPFFHGIGIPYNYKSSQFVNEKGDKRCHRSLDTWRLFVNTLIYTCMYMYMYLYMICSHPEGPLLYVIWINASIALTRGYIATFYLLTFGCQHTNNVRPGTKPTLSL